MVEREKQDRCAEIREILLGEIRASGPLPYNRFIESCLYHPEYGYYMRPDRRIGREGDYYTSPTVGSAFADALAVYVMKCLEAISHGPCTVLEAGAWNGRLLAGVAVELLKQWDGPVGFTAIEKSDACHKNIKHCFKERNLAAPHVHRSLDDVKGPLKGVIFSNELMDAMAVHVLVKRDVWKEVCLAERDGAFIEIEDEPVDSQAVEEADSLFPEAPDGSRLEINLKALEWLEQASLLLETGAVVTIDYGGTSREIASRAGLTGTLRSFYRHTLTDDVLSRPGGQDITHSVNFTSLMERGRELGLESLPLTTQSVFLLANRILEKPVFDQPNGSLQSIKERLKVKTLIDPAGMGQAFRVLVQGRGIALPPLSLDTL
ncbi:class I SAM-dependent methyltransferase [Acidobacteriota bacterium]